MDDLIKIPPFSLTLNNDTLLFNNSLFINENKDSFKHNLSCRTLKIENPLELYKTQFLNTKMIGPSQEIMPLYQTMPMKKLSESKILSVSLNHLTEFKHV